MSSQSRVEGKVNLNGIVQEYRRIEELDGGQFRIHWTETSRFKSTVHSEDEFEILGD